MRIPDPAAGDGFFSKRRRCIDDEKSPRELTFTCYPSLSILGPGSDPNRGKHAACVVSWEEIAGCASESATPFA